MKPLDPRLLRVARSVRGVLALGAVLGGVRAVAIVAWCWCLSQALLIVIAPVLGGERFGAVLDRVPESSTVSWFVLGALAAALVRGGASWALETVAARGAIRAKHDVRSEVLAALDAAPAEHTANLPEAETSTLLGRGLDALDGYFAQYLPQLLLTAVATPLFVAAVWWADWLSGLIVLIVFPVIPLFMALIGLATGAVQKQQWAQLQRLSAAFLDVVSGLPTLKVFRREGRQARRIAAEADAYRRRTMKLLRVTFLSGFVLDLAGTFSVALVAVTIGTRLISGEVPLALGLFVLLLVPEVFLPIRQVGVAYHQSTEGLEAVEHAFAVMDAARAVAREANSSVDPGTIHASSVAGAGAPALDPHEAPLSDGAAPLRFEDVVVRRGTTQIGPVSFQVHAGEIVALSGPSGVGKSTLLAALMGFTTTASGERSATPVAWVGQRPGLVQGTIAENLTLGIDPGDRESPEAEALMRQALSEVGLAPLALEQRLGPLGAGLSGGQAQRLSVARALVRARWFRLPALVLDEPSSALDTKNEGRVLRCLEREAGAGRAVLLVTHREALLRAAHRVVTLAPASSAQRGEES